MSNFPLNIIYALVADLHRNSSHFLSLHELSPGYRVERTRVVSHSRDRIKDNSSSEDMKSGRKLESKDQNKIIGTESQESPTPRQHFQINAVNKVKERSPESRHSQLY